MTSTTQQEISRGSISFGSIREPHCALPLTAGEESEVLKFLAVRPLHTVFMASLIRDNGIISKLNRGSFYGCRNKNGELTGVALLGHATLIETENNHCIKAFADLARHRAPGHVIRGEHNKIESFWNHYTAGNKKPRLLCAELLLQLKAPSLATPIAGLRLATDADLETIININASLVRDESGVNPLLRDPQGFRERAARRISKGRVWVWIENEQLLYKTDIVAETPQAIYLEGVYVHPERRKQGYGLRCISQLAVALLNRTKTICLSVNEKAVGTQRFYKRAGYEFVSRYDSIYLDSQTESSISVA